MSSSRGPPAAEFRGGRPELPLANFNASRAAGEVDRGPRLKARGVLEGEGARGGLPRATGRSKGCLGRRAARCSRVWAAWSWWWLWRAREAASTPDWGLPRWAGWRVGEASHPGPWEDAGSASHASGQAVPPHGPQRAGRPPSRSGPREPRELGRRIDPAVANRYDNAGRRLAAWLQIEGLLQLDAWENEGVREVNQLLALYVQGCYNGGVPYHIAAGAVLYVQARFWWFRGHLRHAWSLLWDWRDGEPVEFRAPITVVLLRAMIALACAWGWRSMATAMWVGFHCLLRPGEIWAVDYEGIILSVDFDPFSDAKTAVIVVALPKTRRKGARRQHVLVEEPMLVKALETERRLMAPGTRLLSITLATFARRFKMLQTALGVRFPVTPASLRAGGATHEYLRSGDINRLLLRGRWASHRSLLHYVQECTTAMRAGLETPEVRSRVLELAALAPQAVAEAYGW